MLKLKEKICFRLVAKKIDCFSPQAKKKICPEKKTIAPPRKSNGCCLRLCISITFKFRQYSIETPNEKNNCDLKYLQYTFMTHKCYTAM